MAIYIGIRGEYPQFSARAVNQATKESFRQVGELWHKRLLPRHFQQGAAARYGYRPRSRRYVARKVRMAASGVIADGRRDLVFSGGLRSQSRSHSVRAFPTRCTITVQGPRYVTMNPRGNRPNMARELTAISEWEEKNEITPTAATAVDRTLAEIMRTQPRRTKKT